MLLKTNEIQINLEKLPLGWAVIGGTNLVKVFEFENFSSGVGFIVKVGELADKADHHPDIKLSWGKVEVSLTTHSESGLTQKDFDLASDIEAVDTN